MFALPVTLLIKWLCTLGLARQDPVWCFKLEVKYDPKYLNTTLKEKNSSWIQVNTVITGDLSLY